MKKTVTCIAMIVSATAFAKKDDKLDKREPAASKFQGYTFASCRPTGQYRDSEAYKNDCLVPLKQIEVPQGGMAPPGSMTKVLGCDTEHVLVVTTYPVRYICLPPGAVEL